MAQTSQAETAEGTGTPRSAQAHLSRLYLWAIGVAVVALVLLASLLMWGSEMDFPTRLSLETSSDGSVRLERTIRKEASRTIDDAVGWMTIEEPGSSTG